MNFAYEGTEVKGINRVGIAPELTGSCTPQELVHGMETEFYTASANGGLVPKTQEQIDMIMLDKSKASAYSTVLENIELRKAEENLKDFDYLGIGYVSDKGSIQSTQNDCLTLGLTDPIRTLIGTPYEGCWHTSDDSFVPHTAGSFLELAKDYFLRGSDNFTTRSLHMINVKTIFEDTTTTAEDIYEYDYSTGWK